MGILTTPSEESLEKWSQATLSRNVIDENSSFGRYLKAKYQNIASHFFTQNNLNGSETIKLINTVGIASAPSIGIHYYILHRHQGVVPHELLNQNKRLYFLGTFGFGTAWSFFNLLKPRNAEKLADSTRIPTMYKSYDLITPESINFDTLGFISALVFGYSIYTNHFVQSSMFQSLKVSKPKNYAFAGLLTLTMYQFIHSAMVKLDVESTRQGKRQVFVEKYITDINDPSSVQKKMGEIRENYEDLKRIEKEGFSEKDMDKIIKRNDLTGNQTSVVGKMSELEMMDYLNKKS